MKNSIAERIELLIKALGYNKRTFSKAIGLGNDVTVGRIINEQREPSYKILNSIISAFDDLNAQWLISGEGEMFRKDYEPRPAGIPLIPTEAVAGFASIDTPGVCLADCERYVIPEFSARGAEFLIRVSGYSMYPRYSNGDILACKKLMHTNFIQWGQVHVIDSTQGVLVKKVSPSDVPGQILCVSENEKEYHPFLLPQEDIRSLSIVLGVIRLE